VTFRYYPQFSLGYMLNTKEKLLNAITQSQVAVSLKPSTDVDCVIKLSQIAQKSPVLAPEMPQFSTGGWNSNLLVMI
jgi:hypothetical protein